MVIKLHCIEKEKRMKENIREQILQELKEVWDMVPSFRFGWLVTNVHNCSNDDHTSSLIYIDDNSFLAGIRKFKKECQLEVEICTETEKEK